MDAPADRDGKVEEGEHLAAHVLDEHVGDDGGRDCGVGRLADAHHGPARHEGPEVGVPPLQVLHKENTVIKIQTLGVQSRVADPDPYKQCCGSGSRAFLTPGSGIRDG
jgi:hypothetical protein